MSIKGIIEYFEFCMLSQSAIELKYINWQKLYCETELQKQNRLLTSDKMRSTFLSIRKKMRISPSTPLHGSGELWLQRIFHAIFFFSALFYVFPSTTFHSLLWCFPATCFRFVCNKWIMLNEWKIVFTLISHFQQRQRATRRRLCGVESNGIFSFSFSHFSLLPARARCCYVCCLCERFLFPFISRSARMYALAGSGREGRGEKWEEKIL